MKCPDGHRWWECKHPELARPVLGSLMMSAGAALTIIGFLEVTGLVR